MPEETRKTQRDDPATPLELDIRALGRRPGSMIRVSRTVPAPADFGLDVIGVPEGADLELDVRLEAVLEGVVVTGTVRAPLVGECVRCLDPVSDVLEADFAELFVPVGQDGDDETRWISGDFIDLDPMLRDAVVLLLPLQPVCGEDCPGLCSECGAHLAQDPEHRHAAVDSRWAALQDLVGQDLVGQDLVPQDERDR
jgi:uncharacterized protein